MLRRAFAQESVVLLDHVGSGGCGLVEMVFLIQEGVVLLAMIVSEGCKSGGRCLEDVVLLAQEVVV